MIHPIRRADVQAEIERFTEIMLAQTGSGEVEVIIRFNVKDRKFIGLRVGGTASRVSLATT